jgi:hypothetical protein
MQTETLSSTVPPPALPPPDHPPSDPAVGASVFPWSAAPSVAASAHTHTESAPGTDTAAAPAPRHESGTVTLTWTLPTTRADNTALPADQIAGTDIYDSASATASVPIGSVEGTANTFTTAVLAVGVHDFTVIVRDTKGLSSGVYQDVRRQTPSSNVATVTVTTTVANPSHVTDLKAVLNP